MSSPIQVDNVLKADAELINRMRAEYKKIADKLDEQLRNLKNLGDEVIHDQMSGPPAEVMEVVWGAFTSKTNPLVKKIYDMIEEYRVIGEGYIAKYEQQKAAAVQQAKDAADKVEAAKKAAQDATK